jgi:hypothetical protein
MLKINKNYIIIIILLVILICLFIFASILHNKNDPRAKFAASNVADNGNNHKCGTTCSSIDDLMDPIYNMTEIIKQSILVEEHIAQPNKRCEDCIAKHLLHIIALNEEAVWLATSRCGDYPLLRESAIFYNEILDLYLDNKKNDKVLLEILEKLRDNRKKLVEIYVNNRKELQAKCNKSKFKN